MFCYRQHRRHTNEWSPKNSKTKTNSSNQQSKRICRKKQKSNMLRLYTFPTSTTYNSREESNTLVTRFIRRFRRTRICRSTYEIIRM